MYTVMYGREGIERFLPSLRSRELEYLYQMNAEHCGLSMNSVGRASCASAQPFSALWLPDHPSLPYSLKSPGGEDGSIARTINSMPLHQRKFFAEVCRSKTDLNVLLDIKRLGSFISPDVIAGSGISANPAVSLPSIREVWDKPKEAMASLASIPLPKKITKDTPTSFLEHGQNAVSSGLQSASYLIRENAKQVEAALKHMNYQIKHGKSKASLEQAYKKLLHEFHSAIPGVTKGTAPTLDGLIKLRKENHRSQLISTLGKGAKHLNPAMKVVDLGSSIHTVYQIKQQGGNWQRATAIEIGGYAAAAAGAGFLVFISSVGWVIVIGAVVGVIGTEVGKQIAAMVWDAYES